MSRLSFDRSFGRVSVQSGGQKYLRDVWLVGFAVDDLVRHRWALATCDAAVAVAAGADERADRSRGRPHGAVRHKDVEVEARAFGRIRGAICAPDEGGECWAARDGQAAYSATPGQGALIGLDSRPDALFRWDPLASTCTHAHVHGNETLDSHASKRSVGGLDPAAIVAVNVATGELSQEGSLLPKCVIESNACIPRPPPHARRHSMTSPAPAGDSVWVFGSNGTDGTISVGSRAAAVAVRKRRCLASLRAAAATEPAVALLDQCEDVDTRARR
jgi:hypothetical protein